MADPLFAFSKANAERIADAVRRIESLEAQKLGAKGFRSVPHPKYIFAKIVSVEDTAGQYGATEQQWDGSDDKFIDLPGTSGGSVYPFSDANFTVEPATEINDRDDVPIGTVVQLFQKNDDEGDKQYFFDASTAIFNPGGNMHFSGRIFNDAGTLKLKIEGGTVFSWTAGNAVVATKDFALSNSDVWVNIKLQTATNSSILASLEKGSIGAYLDPDGDELNILLGTMTTVDGNIVWNPYIEGDIYLNTGTVAHIDVGAPSGLGSITLGLIDGHVDSGSGLTLSDPDCPSLLPDDLLVVSDILAWGDAAITTFNTGTQATDGQAVDDWTMKDANLIPFVQATGSKQPIYRTNETPTGLPAIDFDGLTHLLEALTDLLDVTEFTIIVVHKHDTAASVDECLVSNRGSVAAHSRGWSFGRSAGGKSRTITAAAGDVTHDGTNTIGTGWQVTATRVNPTAVDHLLDAVADNTGTSVSAVFEALTVPAIGACHNIGGGAATQFADVRISEFVVYKADIGEDTTIKIMCGLLEKHINV